jgi:hypothetical protein
LARVPWFARVVILPVPFAVVVTGDEAPVPPFASKVIVEFHCAYKVVLEVGIKVVEPTA